MGRLTKMHHQYYSMAPPTGSAPTYVTSSISYYPTFTGYTNGDYTLSEAGHNANWYGWYAMDNDDSSTAFWTYQPTAGGDNPWSVGDAWLQIDNGADNPVSFWKFRLYFNWPTTQYNPDEWAILGSDDATNWDVIYEVTGSAGGTYPEEFVAYFTSSDHYGTQYRYHRFSITNTRTTSDQILLNEIDFYEVSESAINTLLTYEWTSAASYGPGWGMTTAAAATGITINWVTFDNNNGTLTFNYNTTNSSSVTYEWNNLYHNPGTITQLWNLPINTWSASGSAVSESYSVNVNTDGNLKLGWSGSFDGTNYDINEAFYYLEG